LHLKSIYKSGTPLIQGLAFMAEAAPNRRLTRLGESLQQELNKGRNLKDMVATLSGPLPKAEAALLAAGDQAGVMPEILETLEIRTDERITTRNDLLKRTAYPVLVAVIGCFLLPIPVLVSAGTGAYLQESLTNFGWLLAMIAAVWAMGRYGGWLTGPLLARIPGSLELRMLPGNKTDFLRIMRAGLVSGLPLGMTLEIASEIWNSEANRALTIGANTQLQGGSDLTTALGPLLSPTERFTLAAGERSGTLDEALEVLLKDTDERAGVRRRIMMIVIALLLTLAIMGSVALRVVDGLTNAVMPNTDMMEQLQREMKGTGTRLFD
jgi:general secretion pathway protein F